MHVGRGEYIPKQCFDTARFNAKDSVSLFVRNISVAIFTIEVLVVSSVGGTVCNSTKNKSKSLDGTKLAAVGDITRYFMQQLGINEVQIGIELQKVGRIIGQKIQDLKRAPRQKKRHTNLKSKSTISDDEIEIEQNYLTEERVEEDPLEFEKVTLRDYNKTFDEREINGHNQGFAEESNTYANNVDSEQEFENDEGGSKDDEGKAADPTESYVELESELENDEGGSDNDEAKAPTDTEKLDSVEGDF